MSESPDERRERHLDAMWKHWHEHATFDGMYDALLSALEPPVAEMVRRGIREVRSPHGVILGWEPPDEKVTDREKWWRL